MIPEPSVERLERIGKWLAINQEAIFNTEKLRGNYQQGETIKYTKKKGMPVYFAISLEKPREIVLNYVRPNVDSKIRLLGSNRSLKWEFREGKGLTITIDKATFEEVGDTEAWTFVIEGKEEYK